MNALKHALGEIAEEAKLYEVTERAVRGGRRRRRVARLAPAAVALAVAVGLLAAGMPGQRTGPDRVASPPALVAELLNSSTRGSLAPDESFLAELKDKAAREVPTADGRKPEVPWNPARVRVLFAGDVPGGFRVALVVVTGAHPVLSKLSGPAGAPASRLQLWESDELRGPILWNELLTDDGAGRSVLVLGPVGSQVEVSGDPHYLADGSVRRTWTPEPAGSGYLVRGPNIPAGLRVRFNRDGALLYEADVTPSINRTPVTFDPTPRAGRPAPVAAQEAAKSLRVTSPGVRYVVLWSDDLPVHDPNGDQTGIGTIATVMAQTPDGGGPYTTFLVGAGHGEEPVVRDHPTGSGVIGDPDHSVIAMRLPSFDRQTDDLQIVAPPAAVRAEIVSGGAVIGSTVLNQGAGRLKLARTEGATVRAYDAAGSVVAQGRFTDDFDGWGYGRYEREIRAW
ncbi:hypothetical protein [Planosporangium mesophilum]|uniref:Uncharacterized protein n=1 Tax=Planosporangium mesophilum TaxID=689768 RepID=A0A8J3X102_9ACTN|nr:hypothetical protein [Planosporangium mesophilum]NJC81875.1 hypothetical protein [Planosporangium mesophilum]GII20463.1 hypothetical protein Pme01_00600 [Planosporangium mesophilum]